MPRERKFFTVAVNRVALESCTMQVLAVSEAAAKKRAVDLLNDVVDRRSGESQSTWQFRSVTKRPKVVSVTANGQAEVAVASVPSTPDSAPDQDDPEDADEGGFDDEDSEDDGEG